MTREVCRALPGLASGLAPAAYGGPLLAAPGRSSPPRLAAPGHVLQVQAVRPGAPWRALEAVEKLSQGRANSVLEGLDQSLSVDEAQAREFPDATYCRYGLSSCQQFIDFGSALLVQEGDQLLTSPAIGFLLGGARYSDWSEP